MSKIHSKLESSRLKLKYIKNWVNDTLLWNVLVWFWSGFNFLEMLKCHAIWSYLKFLEAWLKLDHNTCLLRVNHSLLFFIIVMYSWNLTSILYQKRYYSFNLLNFVKFILNIISRICTSELFFQPLLAKVYALNFRRNDEYITWYNYQGIR